MSQCFKCKQGIGTIASRDGPRTLYCAECFLRYCTNLVRDNAFQQCFMACDTPLAVAVSGGPNSMLLLRELGQLRRKTEAQYRRQHVRPLRNDTTTAASAPPPTPMPLSSPPPSSPHFTSQGSTFHLLPFHLCEAELVVPPALGAATTTTLAPASATAADAAAAVSSSSSASPEALAANLHAARQAAVDRVRASMQDQFDVLQKLVRQQPPLWVYHDESLDDKKKKKKQKSKQNVTDERHVATSHDADTINLFDKTEMRVFHYSDFLPPTYLKEVRHALHASKLSLTDREALYDRIKQQVLCRAAQQLTDEFWEKQRRAASAARRDNNSGADPNSESTPDCPVVVERAAGTSQASPPWCHLITGDNAARCATAALEAIVSGAGGDGTYHAAAFRSLQHRVVRLRPLRTMLPKESVLCSRLHGITSTYTPALSTGTSLRSMHQVLEQFVYTMIVSFRTMIFNVLNTVQKLRVHPAAMADLVQFVGAVDTSGNHADVKNEESDEARLIDSVSHTQRSFSSSAAPAGSKKALPGRTAQQNQRDLRAMQPPVVFTSNTALTAAHETLTHAVAVQCCVCGCPASAPSSTFVRESSSREVEMFAVSGALHSSCNTSLNCFVCYACRALFEAWPPSALGTEASENALRNAPADVLKAACAIFQ